MLLCRVVGYANVSTNGAMYISAGAVFTPVNGANTFLLKEWKPDGVEENDDFQLLSAENATTTKEFCYITKECADATSELMWEVPGMYDHAIGWWKLGKVDWDDESGTSEFRADNEIINVGDSFLIACGGSRNLSIQSSGQVQTEENSIERKNSQYLFFCNYLPVDVKLGNITVDGVEENDDFQLLSSENAVTIAEYCYISKACADATSELMWEVPGMYDHAIGWWKLGKVDWDDELGTSEFRADNVILGAGQGVLLAKGVASDVTITFPSALEATK